MYKKTIECICKTNIRCKSICPRCGKATMDPNGYNALSRYADVMICSDCGTAEAMLDFFELGYDGELPVWACLQSDF